MSSIQQPAPAPRKRIQFTHQQKQEIRDYYYSHYQCSAKQLRTWFEDKYGLPLRPSTISTILRASDKTQVSSNTIRARLPKYPELERRLQEWVEARIAAAATDPTTGAGAAGLYFTNEMLKTAAQELWKQLPEYARMDAPSFSEGWIEKFKRRTNMPRLRRHPNTTANTPVAGSPTQVKLPPPSQIIAGALPQPVVSLPPPASLLPALQYLNTAHNPIHNTAQLPAILPPPSDSFFVASAAVGVPGTPTSGTSSPPPGLGPRRYSNSSSSSMQDDSSPDSARFHNILNPVPSTTTPISGASTTVTSRVESPAPLIPPAVAKCHLQILKIYVEQQPGDSALKSSFRNIEEVLESQLS